MFLYILSIVDDTVHQNYWLAGQLQGILGMQTEILLPMFCLRDFFIRPTYPFCAPCAYFGYMWALPKMYRKTWSERVKSEECRPVGRPARIYFLSCFVLMRG